MTSQFVRNAHRLQHILLANGLDTRSKILAAFDGEGRGSVGISGIGPKLQHLLVLLLDPEQYGMIEWQALMPNIEWQPGQVA